MSSSFVIFSIQHSAVSHTPNILLKLYYNILSVKMWKAMCALHWCSLLLRPARAAVSDQFIVSFCCFVLSFFFFANLIEEPFYPLLLFLKHRNKKCSFKILTGIFMIYYWLFLVVWRGRASAAPPWPHLTSPSVMWETVNVLCWSKYFTAQAKFLFIFSSFCVFFQVSVLQGGT